MYRYMEVDASGVAFHSTDAAGQQPPAEVHYCDCAGKGRHTYNPHVPKGRLNDLFRQTPADDLEHWKRQHAGPRCSVRRQIFVDTTDRSDLEALIAQYASFEDFWASTFERGLLRYDEASDRFYVTTY